MKYSTITIIAFLSFSVLAAVQLYLVNNTYELKNDRYYYSEKSALLDTYGQSVMKDMMFEGGHRILDSVISANSSQLDLLYKTDHQQFEEFKQKVAADLFTELRKGESILPVLNRFKKENKVTDSLEYVLMLEYLDISTASVKNMNIYSKDKSYRLIDKDIPEPGGIRLGGNLQRMDNQNRIVQLTIGDGSALVSELKYSLHVEPVNRKQTIIGQMGLTLLLSLLSVLSVVLLFYVTFRNWIRQKKLSEMKSDFLNNITHEFHTPLTAIQVANKSLQNEKIIEKKENIKPLADVIQRQSDRLKMLIGQVLDIVSMNEMKLQKKECAVNKLLGDILIDYPLNLADKNVEIVFNEKAEPDTVRLDPFHFTTTILNILDNAVKYNNHAKQIISIATAVDEDHFIVIIKDNGIGMSPETMKHIFEKFYRGSDNGFHPTKGLGLGLYYVKQSINAHQWKISVNSRPGEGSTFRIKIALETQAV